MGLSGVHLRELACVIDAVWCHDDMFSAMHPPDEPWWTIGSHGPTVGSSFVLDFARRLCVFTGYWGRTLKWRHRRNCQNLETYGGLSQLQGYRFTSGFFLWSSKQKQHRWTLWGSRGCNRSSTVCEKVLHPVYQNSRILLDSDHFTFNGASLWQKTWHYTFPTNQSMRSRS